MRRDWARLLLVGAHVLLLLLVLLDNGQNAYLAFFAYIGLVSASAGFDASADVRRRVASLAQFDRCLVRIRNEVPSPIGDNMPPGGPPLWRRVPYNKGSPPLRAVSGVKLAYS